MGSCGLAEEQAAGGAAGLRPFHPAQTFPPSSDSEHSGERSCSFNLCFSSPSSRFAFEWGTGVHGFSSALQHGAKGRRILPGRAWQPLWPQGPGQEKNLLLNSDAFVHVRVCIKGFLKLPPSFPGVPKEGGQQQHVGPVQPWKSTRGAVVPVGMVRALLSPSKKCLLICAASGLKKGHCCGSDFG